jgi:dCMP deaminase
MTGEVNNLYMPMVEGTFKLTNHSQKEWDDFYLGLATYVSTKSKDPSTKVGAAIVRPDHSLASVGFNGFPQKMPDHKHLYENREEKYSRIIHGEINAMNFCSDANLHGYCLYTIPFMPCDRCFVQMVQKGITRFVAPKATAEQLTRWGPAFDRVRLFAKECNVELIEIDFA